jgi:hypothetical protein
MITQNMALIERLFAEGTVVMGPSRTAPGRQVATLDSGRIIALNAARSEALEKFRWLAGDWEYENPVPATSLSPAYCDAGRASFAPSEDGRWLCMVGPGGRLTPVITFDPWSQTWIYVLTNGSYGLLRSRGWDGDEIVFTGLMTMIGIECEWRMRWMKSGEDAFGFVNEERAADGSWLYIDEWRYRRI